MSGIKLHIRFPNFNGATVEFEELISISAHIL